jgi:hypothetical protein
MNNADKHRIIHIVNVRAATATIEIEGLWTTRPAIDLSTWNGPIEDGAILGRYPADVEVKPRFTLSIGFGDPAAKYFRFGVFRTLGHIHKRVTEIIDTFASVFP